MAQICNIMNEYNIKKNKYSLKAIWTKICVTKLYQKEHIYLNRLNDEATKNNLNLFLSFINDVSDLCNGILSAHVPEGDNEIRFKVEHLLFQCLIDVQKDKIARFTTQYCESLIQWCENPFEWNHIEDIFNGVHTVLLTSPILMERLFLDVVVKVVKEHLKSVMTEHQHDYQMPLLDRLLTIYSNVIEDRLLPHLFPRNEDRRKLLPEDLVYRLYFEVRLPLIFEVIMEYPDSLVAIQDLGRCVTLLGAGVELCEKLGRAIRERLLHPAVETANLITAYVCIIKSLRALDPAYVYEEVVTPAIRRTLLRREDTIKAIVDKVLTVDEDTDDSIYTDLARPTPIRIVVQNELTEFGDVKCTIEDMDSWNPDPISSLGVRGLWHKPLDVLSLLLSIYNSRELFASEYKSLLSKRLIKSMNFDVEKELKNLETLKLRFGPHNLQDCDVMLKDIRESKRVTNTIRDKIVESGLTPPFNIQPYIISANYWPRMTDKEFRLPDKLKTAFDMYSRLYSDYKRNRELKWYQMLGSVDIEVELHGRRVRTEVTSLQASVIHYFCESGHWQLHDLARVLVTNVSRVRSAVNFWIQREFLKSVPDDGEAYSLVDADDVEAADNRKKVIDIECTGDSEDENGEQHGRQEAKIHEDLWMIVSFILRRASDQKMAMDIDKILATIPIYTTDDPITVTRDQLEAFLDSKVSHKLLTVNQKNYSLNRTK